MLAVPSAVKEGDDGLGNGIGKTPGVRGTRFGSEMAFVPKNKRTTYAS